MSTGKLSSSKPACAPLALPWRPTCSVEGKARLRPSIGRVQIGSSKMRPILHIWIFHIWIQPWVSTIPLTPGAASASHQTTARKWDWCQGYSNFGVVYLIRFLIFFFLFASDESFICYQEFNSLFCWNRTSFHFWLLSSAPCELRELWPVQGTYVPTGNQPIQKGVEEYPRQGQLGGLRNRCFFLDSLQELWAASTRSKIKELLRSYSVAVW